MKGSLGMVLEEIIVWSHSDNKHQYSLDPNILFPESKIQQLVLKKHTGSKYPKMNITMSLKIHDVWFSSNIMPLYKVFDFIVKQYIIHHKEEFNNEF